MRYVVFIATLCWSAQITMAVGTPQDEEARALLAAAESSLAGINVPSMRAIAVLRIADQWRSIDEARASALVRKAVDLAQQMSEAERRLGYEYQVAALASAARSIAPSDLLLARQLLVRGEYLTDQMNRNQDQLRAMLVTAWGDVDVSRAIPLAQRIENRRAYDFAVMTVAMTLNERGDKERARQTVDLLRDSLVREAVTTLISVAEVIDSDATDLAKLKLANSATEIGRRLLEGGRIDLAQMIDGVVTVMLFSVDEEIGKPRARSLVALTKLMHDDTLGRLCGVADVLIDHDAEYAREVLEECIGEAQKLNLGDKEECANRIFTMFRAAQAMKKADRERAQEVFLDGLKLLQSSIQQSRLYDHMIPSFYCDAAQFYLD